MMQAFAPAFEVLLVAGFAGEMLDELDLGIPGIGERELEILLRRAAAELFVTSLTARNPRSRRNAGFPWFD